MYNNPYFNSQMNVEMLNNQIAELERRKNQLQHNQPSINQTFQLAPNSNSTMRFVNSEGDLSNELVFGDTAFFSKGLDRMWIKSVKGDIRTFDIKEIVPKDEKDLIIENLQDEIKKLKEDIYETRSNEYIEPTVIEPSETKKSTSVSTSRGNAKK